MKYCVALGIVKTEKLETEKRGNRHTDLDDTTKTNAFAKQTWALSETKQAEASTS